MSDKYRHQLTVVVPTWNQKDLLRSCLDSLRRQTAHCAVLVVDNGSNDSTAEMVAHEFPNFQYLNLGRNQGFAKAVNVGIKSCDAEFIALLNNDTEADTRWVDTGLRAFREQPDYWYFASKIVNYFRRDQLDSAGDCYSRTGLPYKRGSGEPVERFVEPQPVLGASAGAAFYRRALFDEIGFFDEDFFMYLEDVDLSLRAQVAGRRCLYLPEAVVYHIEAASDPHRQSKEGNRARLRTQQPAVANQPPAEGSQPYRSPARVYWITRNRWQLMVTYQPLRHLPWLAYGWIRSALFHLLKAGFLGSFVRGLAAGVLQTPRALKKRTAIRRNRVTAIDWLCQLIKEC